MINSNTSSRNSALAALRKESFKATMLFERLLWGVGFRFRQRLCPFEPYISPTGYCLFYLFFQSRVHTRQRRSRFVLPYTRSLLPYTRSLLPYTRSLSPYTRSLSLFRTFSLRAYNAHTDIHTHTYTHTHTHTHTHSHTHTLTHIHIHTAWRA